MNRKEFQQGLDAVDLGISELVKEKGDEIWKAIQKMDGNKITIPIKASIQIDGQSITGGVNLSFASDYIREKAVFKVDTRQHSIQWNDQIEEDEKEMAEVDAEEG